MAKILKFSGGKAYILCVCILYVCMYSVCVCKLPHQKYSVYNQSAANWFVLRAQIESRNWFPRQCFIIRNFIKIIKIAKIISAQGTDWEQKLISSSMLSFYHQKLYQQEPYYHRISIIILTEMLSFSPTMLSYSSSEISWIQAALSCYHQPHQVFDQSGLLVAD